jgi:hypothetical protein
MVLITDQMTNFKAASSTLRQPVTVVTAYYLFKSKHSHKEYTEWMKNFFSKIPCPLIVFADFLMLPMVRKLRSPHLDKTRFYEKNFSDFQMSQKGGGFWKKQTELDPELKRRHHTANVYIMWNEKIKLVVEAIERDAFGSDFFVWCDAGSFRSKNLLPHLRTFPNPAKLAHLNPQKLYFLQSEEFNKTDFVIGHDGLPTHNFQFEARVGGTVIVGHKIAWRKWDGVYYDILDRMARAGRFVGKDQNIMASLAVMHPEMIELIKPQPYFGATGNPWFYLHYYFS